MRRLVLGVLAVVLLLGCGRFEPLVDSDPEARINMTVADLTGLWRNEQKGGTLFFAEDGTFQATNVPPEVFDGFDDLLSPSFDKARDRIDVDGDWRWDLSNAPSPLHAQLFLGFDQSGFLTAGLQTKIFAHQVGLAFYFDDSDIGTYVYLKCTQACPTPSANPTNVPLPAGT